MKKKYIVLGLCVVLSLSACGGQKATPEPQQEPDQKVVQQTETTPDLVQVKAETPIEPEAPAGENAVDVAAPIEEVTPVEEDETVETVDLFTSCEETVYATGEVNIRASWSSSSDKLGSLTRGDSVIRTGNSITGTEAENWSRVQLSDGSTAYINNNYLSLTKPAVQQATTGGTGGGTATGGSGGASGSDSKTTQQQATQQTPAQPASGDTLTEADKKAMEQAIAPGQAPGGSVNSIPGVTFGPEGLTEEQRQRQAEKSGAILRGEAQLQIDENGVYYYEF